MNSNCSSVDLQREFDARIESHLRHYYLDCLGLYDWEKRIDDRKNEIARAESWLAAIEEIARIKLAGKKMLDVGCGWGGHMVAGAKLGADCVGCDADGDVLEVARIRMKLTGSTGAFCQAPAENLPFKDDHFDYVQAASVLEHVEDVSTAVKEMLRVLKPGGVGFVQVPNYFIPVEQHYKIIFPPKCPKKLAKVYLWLLSRPTGFIDTINYVDYKMIKNVFESHGAKVVDIFSQFSMVSAEYRSKQPISILPNRKIPIRSYRALMGKLMAGGSAIVVRYFQNVLGIRNIYFLFEKQK